MKDSQRQSDRERISLIIIAVITFIVSCRFDFLEKIVAFSNRYENYEIDELITVSIMLVFCQAILLHKRWARLRQAKKCLENRNRELQEAMAEIRQLKGIIPICTSCKKIRDNDGYWHQVEAYLCAHSEAQFSHGLCPACMDSLCKEILGEKP